MIRARSHTLWFVLAAACNDPPAATPAPAPETPPAEFRAQAHVDAYERLRPLTQAALDRGDPLAAAQLTTTDMPAPAPAPFSQSARAALRVDIDAAWTEAQDIDGDALGLERGVLLRTMRFALNRLRDEHMRRPSSRIDPALGLRSTARLLDEIERRGPGCTGCDGALAAAAVELDAALADVGASSVARTKGALVEHDAVHARIEAWPEPVRGQPGVLALLEALARANTRITAIALALPKAQPAPDSDRIAPAAAASDVLRMPDRIGADALRRWLDVQESELGELSALANDLGRALAQLDALARKDLEASASTAALPAAAVDLARCEQHWQTVSTWVKTQPALTDAKLECKAALTRLPTRADDAELLVALVQLGVVEPTELAHRRSADPVLGRIGGMLAPAAHRHALGIAALSGLAQPAARARQLTAARDDVCLAITALWIHGELGDEATLGERIAHGCAHRPTTAWIDDAVARPERALAGLGLALLATGPADAVALEQLWWLPLGLVIPLARPSVPVDMPVEVHTEPLVPGGGTGL